MEEKKKHTIKNDILLIGILLLIAAAAMFYVKGKQKEAPYVQIRIDDMVEGIYPLDEDRTIPLAEEMAGVYANTVVIEDGKAYMLEADCPDQICVNHTPIHQQGEIIVCLPHRVIVEVIQEGSNGGGPIDMISK